MSKKVIRIMHNKLDKVMRSDEMEDGSKLVGPLWYIVSITRLIMMSDC